MASQDELLANRARLEIEVAGLRSQLDRANARLEGLHTSGAEPRGMVPGVFAGGLVVVAGFLWFLYLVAGVLGHD